ncbi:c-type cytochrome biogenesis protein CcmI [Halomonas sp. NO4]|uniref:c-type cytochrome biogenesis protein CcmI n=1 Tax=Halomonas sp. NO4 TaxID=2484813 RepID=UPI0013D80522|nr:c-type cytochrome biogenesis protein CcmI [Halomonas sp. NO4]
MNGLFLILALALCLLALTFVAYPLLRPSPREGGETPAAVNRAVHRDRVRELDQDLAAGLLTPAQYELALADLERELLDSGALAEGGAAAPRPRSRRLATLAAALSLAGLPFAAMGLYLGVGHAEAVFAIAEPASREAPPVSAEGRQREFQMLAQQLQGRLADAPDDLESWVLLGQTQVYLDDPAAAERAFREAMRHGGDRDPDLLTRYADVVAERQGGLAGEPATLIEQALALDPDHPQGLWMAGTLAFEQQEPGAARQHWERLLEVLPAESREAEIIRGNLAQVAAANGEG